MSSLVFHKCFTVILFITCIISAILPIVSSECEDKFDTLYCDYNTSRGHGFRGNQIWDIECYSNSIDVIKNSNKPFDLGPIDAAFVYESYLYLIKGSHAIVVSKDDPFVELKRVETKVMFSAYNYRVRSVFEYKDMVYVWNGTAFHLFDMLLWHQEPPVSRMFAAKDPWVTKLKHRRLNDLKISVVVPSDDQGRGELVLFLRNNHFYRIRSIEQCIDRRKGIKDEITFMDYCFYEDGPKRPDAFMDCVLFSWRTVCLILLISLIAVAFVSYLCCILICYRRNRNSGVFKHQHQNCCKDGEDFSDDDPCHTSENGKLNPNHHEHHDHNNHKFVNGKQTNGSCKTNVDEEKVDGYGEDQISIDLRETPY